jgi:protein KRI1
MLSDADDSDDLHQITVNEHYAKAFQYKKEREELDKRASSPPTPLT